MRPVVKGLLAGCIVLLVLGALGVFFVVRFWNANKDKVRAQADATRAEAREFGRTANDSGCVAKTLEVYRNDASLLKEARARIWLAGCLETSQPETAYCSAVPKTDEIMRTVSWRLSECAAANLDGDKGCTRILGEVQKYCEGDARKAKMR